MKLKIKVRKIEVIEEAEAHGTNKVAELVHFEIQPLEVRDRAEFGKFQVGQEFAAHTVDSHKPKTKPRRK